MTFARPQRTPAPPGDIICGLVVYRERERSFEIFTRVDEPLYQVQVDRIASYKQFTDWLWQLHEKGWMTGQHYADLLRCISEYIFRQHGQWPQAYYEVEGAINQGLDKV